VPGAPPAPRPAPAPATPNRASRTEQRNAEVRAQLEPLAPGERPLPVTVAAIVAVAVAAANVIAYAAGAEINGKHTGVGSLLVFVAIMLAAAWGMWNNRYWAVLGFQALLAITLIIVALALIVASNVRAVILCVAILTSGGWLFWKLIRAMARIQMPERPGP
jgi:hypothetical protein